MDLHNPVILIYMLQLYYFWTLFTHRSVINWVNYLFTAIHDSTMDMYNSMSVIVDIHIVIMDIWNSIVDNCN